jgi:hypothetical protein
MSGRASNLGNEQGDHDLDATDDEYIEMNASQLQSIQETLNDLTLSFRFFVKSSGANLIQAALNLKSEYSGTEADHIRIRVGRSPTRVLDTALCESAPLFYHRSPSSRPS